MQKLNTMKDNKRAFIAKELLNMPDCVSLIIKELKVDFISFQRLCQEYKIVIQSERDRLSRHDFIKIKEPLIERLKEIKTKTKNSNISPVHFNSVTNNKKQKMTHSPIFDKMASQKEKIKFISSPMRD